MSNNNQLSVLSSDYIRLFPDDLDVYDPKKGTEIYINLYHCKKGKSNEFTIFDKEKLIKLNASWSIYLLIKNPFYKCFDFHYGDGTDDDHEIKRKISDTFSDDEFDSSWLNAVEIIEMEKASLSFDSIEKKRIRKKFPMSFFGYHFGLKIKEFYGKELISKDGNVHFIFRLLNNPKKSQIGNKLVYEITLDKGDEKEDILNLIDYAINDLSIISIRKEIDDCFKKII